MIFQSKCASFPFSFFEIVRVHHKRINSFILLRKYTFLILSGFVPGTYISGCIIIIIIIIIIVGEKAQQTVTLQ